MRKVSLFLAAILIIVFTNPLVSIANVRFELLSGYGYGVPYYANLGGILPDGSVWVMHTDEWATIPFFRDPDCVPEDFNLVYLADFDNAYNCYSFVEGFEIWKNGPGIDPTPIQIELKAVEPMPVYFVPWPTLKDALEDYELTVPELEKLTGLRIGLATFYTETTHPGTVSGPYMDEAVASGNMTDNGDRFELKYTWIHDDVVPKNIKIEFKSAKSAPALKPQSKLATTWGAMKGKN